MIIESTGILDNLSNVFFSFVPILNTSVSREGPLVLYRGY